ncbi:MAG: acetyl-CoA C-acyltransferase [Actinomycetota bacterium]|nr:acetyl-CoA C-acyltransferase [Actinomycetota bacterium]
MPEAVIVDAVRTPIGRAFKGSLIENRPDDMAAYVIDQLLERNPDVDPASVADVIMGCGMTQGEQAYNIGRIAVLLSEKLPDSVTGATIARYCASSLNAIQIAADSIKAGTGDVYVAAGIESVSRAGPHSENVLPETQNSKLKGENGTPNAYISMGETAENVADRFNVKREDMDEYAKRSQDLAVESRDQGFFDREIVPVHTPDGNVVDKDDGPRPGTTLEKLAELKPAFREEGGRVTAGNSCPLNDGAAAVLLTSDEKAKELGLKPRARVIAAATSGLEPEIMGVAPIGAIHNVLQKAGMTIADVDVVELNEAFAAQVIPIMEKCEIPLEKLNPHGGAIALGHPFGMTGARIMTTLLNDLETDDKQIGLETMCVAGGQGFAMVVERLN